MRRFMKRRARTLAGYAEAALGVGLTTALIALILSRAAISNASILYLVVILTVAVRHGSGPSVFAALLAFLAFNWFHIHPVHTLTVAEPEELLALLLFLTVAAVTSQLASAQRRRGDEARRREAQLRALVIERDRLQGEAMDAEVLRRTDSARAALLASVSHDLRTPLASIKASAGSLLQEEVRWSPEERRAFARAIEEESDRLNQIVQELLDMSRIEAGAITPSPDFYPLDALVYDVVGRLRGAAAEHLVEVDVPDDLPPVPFDYVQIGQVLYNLLENALKYTPPGSHITISARMEGDSALVSIADDGPGIPADALPQVFQKFFRVRSGDTSGTRGTGLGLAVARGFAEAHGGSLIAHSPPPGAAHGALFELRLPARSGLPTPQEIALDRAAERVAA
jgi:K+-sensing histidine kinase KdpD